MNSRDGLMFSGLQPMDTDVAEGLQPMDTDVAEGLLEHHAVAKETVQIVEGVKKTIQNKEKKTLRSYNGAGAPQLDELYSELRTWFEKRRSDGYYLDAAALLIQFEYVIKTCQMDLIAKMETTDLTREEMQKLHICEEKLIDLAKPKSRRNCSERLRLEVGAVWLKPHVLQAHFCGNDKRIELANSVSQAVEVD